VRECGLDLVVSRVLASRGFEPGSVLNQFLQPSLREGLPHPSGIKNMDRAVGFLAEALASQQKIAVCSDFDVDGLTSAAQLVDFVSRIHGSVTSYVPDRFEDGYGLSASLVEKAKAEGADLLIAVDFGTKNGPQLELARSLGMKTIVLDHHDVSGIVNPADAFVNPQQAGCSFADGILCSAGLSWYFIAAARSSIPAASAVDPRDFLDLACLGTICDMVPLKGVNRVIARRGLECLETTKRIGLRELKKVAGVRNSLRSYDVSFGLGPRINAAGRIEHGEIVVKLLTTTSSSEAARLAKRLDRLNAERQDVEGKVRARALELVKATGNTHSGIAVWHPEFHPGVIGIVAQRLVEQYYRPTAVMGRGSDGIFKGSVRGIRGLSVVELLSKLSPYLLSYGGHEGAGGFSIQSDRIKGFCQAFDEVCSDLLSEDQKTPTVVADTEVQLNELTVDLAESFEHLSPFGVGNPAPILLSRALRVVEVRELRGGHLKTILSDGSKSITGMLWRVQSHPALTRDAIVDLAYKLDVNSYLGDRTLQATLQAVNAVQERFSGGGVTDCIGFG
jgi:single-stranded-DNA-specific exonuclease